LELGHCEWEELGSHGKGSLIVSSPFGKKGKPGGGGKSPMKRREFGTDGKEMPGCDRTKKDSFVGGQTKGG